MKSCLLYTSYLALRSYGSQELYEKLCMKFDTPSSAAAVAEMQRLGLLDDAAFARARARHLACLLYTSRCV